MYLVFTRIPGKSYRRQLWSLLLCLCDVSRALINSLISVSIVQKTTTTNSSQPGHCLPTWMCPDLQRRQLQPDGQLWSLLCLCDVSRALINSLMCRLLQKTTTTNSSQPGHCLPTWRCPDLQRRQLRPDGQLWSLLLCLCDVSRALINSLVCRLYRLENHDYQLLPTRPLPPNLEVSRSAAAATPTRRATLAFVVVLLAISKTQNVVRT